MTNAPEAFPMPLNLAVKTMPTNELIVQSEKLFSASWGMPVRSEAFAVAFGQVVTMDKELAARGAHRPAGGLLDCRHVANAAYGREWLGWY